MPVSRRCALNVYRSPAQYASKPVSPRILVIGPVGQYASRVNSINAIYAGGSAPPTIRQRATRYAKIAENIGVIPANITTGVAVMRVQIAGSRAILKRDAGASLNVNNVRGRLSLRGNSRISMIENRNCVCCVFRNRASAKDSTAVHQEALFLRRPLGHVQGVVP